MKMHPLFNSRQDNPSHVYLFRVWNANLLSLRIQIQYMSNAEEDDSETMEFYKIKLMEKDRQISDFETKMKKIQFKHTRDIKEVKLAEQRAKNLLKDQKAKVDKLSKQAKQNQEQSNLLQMRLAELKQDKDREITEIRTQYNAIKQQIRSYERILPTLTFLTEMDLKIEKIPTYEDVFMNLKQKNIQNEQISVKFDNYRAKAEQTARTYEQNQQMLKNKKIEAEKNIKDLLPKIIQYQHQIADLRINNEDYHAIIERLHGQLQYEKERSQNYEAIIKEYEQQIKDINQAHIAQLNFKQEEAKQSNREQFDKYQQEIYELRNKLQKNESMYTSVIQTLEEENQQLQTQIQTEKETFEQNYFEIKEKIQLMGNQIDKEKYQYEELQQKNRDLLSNLVQVSKSNEQYEEKIKRLQNKIQSQGQFKKQDEQRRKLHSINSNKIIQLEDQKDSLTESNVKLVEEVQVLRRQRDSLIDQNTALRLEIESTNQYFKQNSKPNFLDIPSNMDEQNERLRRKSTQIEKFEQELVFITNEKIDCVRERRKTIESYKQQDSTEKQRNEFHQRYEEKVQQNKRLLEVQKQLQNKIQELNKLFEVKIKQPQSEKKEKGKFFDESTLLKQKIVFLTKYVTDDVQKNNPALITRQNLQKTRIQSLQQQLKLLSNQSKKDKDVIKVQKQQIKQLKEANLALLEKQANELKEFTAQVQLLKQEKQKIKNDLISKEQEFNRGMALLKNDQQLQLKLRQQIASLKEDIIALQNQKIQQNKKLAEMNKDSDHLQKQIEKLTERIFFLQRENELISQSLERERKQRTLRTVPSLHSIQEDQAEQQNFNQIYAMITQKEGQINILNRLLSDGKEQMQSLRQSCHHKLEALQAQRDEYIKDIITMKVKCAESEMRACEKQYLYSKLKKKMAVVQAVQN